MAVEIKAVPAIIGRTVRLSPSEIEIQFAEIFSDPDKEELVKFHENNCPKCETLSKKIDYALDSEDYSWDLQRRVHEAAVEFYNCAIQQ